MNYTQRLQDADYRTVLEALPKDASSLPTIGSEF
jgi:hypothetical protein